MKFVEALLEAEKRDRCIHHNMGVPILVFKLDKSDWDVLWKPFTSKNWRSGGIKKLCAWDIIINEDWEVFVPYF